MKPYKILVIIINYKTSHLIQGLINSITEDKVEVSFLIVDNASTTESYNELQTITDHRVHILQSKQNLGFTGGINYALKYVVDNIPETKYFFLINPDAFSCPNLIGELIELLETDQNAACISPRILHLNGEPWYSGALMDFGKGIVVNNSKSKQTTTKQKYHEVDVFSGCASVFSLEKVLKTGMLNEDLFMYFDEADFSIKLKEKGYKILYSPNHQIFHDVSYTTKNISYLKTYYMTRNKFMVFNKSMSVYSKIYFLIHELGFHVKNRRFKNAYYHIQGYYHFLKGRKGALIVT